MKHTANLFLNGSYTDYGDLIDRTLYTIAADGGVVNALKNNCAPAVVVGDGDSIKEVPDQYRKEVYAIPFIHTPDQDFTDFEKALSFLQEKKYTYINVFCFQGERIDHMIAGLSACSRFQTLAITLYTNSLIVKKLPYSSRIECETGETISLLPLPSANHVTTSGLQWDLQDSLLELGGFISISNKALQNEVEIQYTKGTLYLFRPIKK